MDVGYGKATRHVARMVSIVEDDKAHRDLRRRYRVIDVGYGIALALCLLAAGLGANLLNVPLILAAILVFGIISETGLRIIERTEDAALVFKLLGAGTTFLAVASIGAAFHASHMRDVVVAIFLIAGPIGIAFHFVGWQTARRQKHDLAAAGVL